MAGTISILVNVAAKFEQICNSFKGAPQRRTKSTVRAIQHIGYDQL
jgi:hypothetical protein